MGKYLVLFAAAAAVFASIATGAERQKKFTPGAAIYVKAQAPLKDALPSAAGVRLSNGSWLKENKDFGISATANTSAEWKPLSFSFVPSADGDVEIMLRSRFFRGDDGKISRNATFFDDVKIGDKTFTTFRDGLDGWKKYKGARLVQENENSAAFVTYENYFSMKIGVKAGEKIEVSARVKNGGLPEAEKYLDMRKFANIPYADETPNSDGEYVALKNIDFSRKQFGGINFRMLNPSESGGAGVVALSSLRAPKSSKMEFDFGGNVEIFKYLYVLHSSGKNLRKPNKMKNVGQIRVVYSDGMTANFWVKKDSEAMSAYGRMTGDNGIPVYTENEKKKSGTVYMSRYILESKPVKKIVFTGLGYAAWNIFAATTTNKNLETTDFYKFKESEWRPVDISDLEIKSGSALDVSAGMGHAPAGKFGRLKISPAGRFVFEGAPNLEVKFKGTNWRPGDQFFRKINTKEDIDTLAKMARKQGYNMVRWRLSMRGAKEFSEPYKMIPEVLDMYDYFLYAMGREGVYTHLNLSSHDLGVPTFEWKDRNGVKLKMLLGDKETREAWRKLVHMQLNHVNPYTGKKWKDDPAIATTEYFNEMEIGFSGYRGLDSEVVKFANAEMNAWLKKKYGTVEKLKEEWKARKQKTDFDDFSQINVFGDVSYRYNNDRSQFIMERGKEFLAYCENVVRNEEKFTPPLHQFNCGRRLDVEFLSAHGGSYMAQNVYFAHPSEFNSVDSSTPQGSSLAVDEALGYFRGASAKRMADRPMALTEWQHCFWNPYMHEAGVTFPALAALQGFENLTVHDYAIEKKGVGIFGHAEVSKNPIMRANEFLSYCFFFRGDVKKSPHRVDIVYDRSFVEESGLTAYSMDGEQSKISLITGMAIDFPSAGKIGDLKDAKAKPADIVLKPAGYSQTMSQQNFVETGESKGESIDLDKFVSVLREKKIISADNITNPSQGVFQSDTGEIILRLCEELARVVTPNSEAVALKPATKNEKLGVLTVKSTDVPASVAVVGVDGNPLAKSGRMVLIYATDAAATGLKLSVSRKLMKQRGRQPIIVRVGKLSATLKLPESAAGKTYSLYALSLTGERVEKIPAKIENNTMFIEIDTSKLEKEPATFYEIVEE